MTRFKTTHCQRLNSFFCDSFIHAKWENKQNDITNVISKSRCHVSNMTFGQDYHIWNWLNSLLKWLRHVLHTWHGNVKNSLGTQRMTCVKWELTGLTLNFIILTISHRSPNINMYLSGCCSYPILMGPGPPWWWSWWEQWQLVSTQCQVLLHFPYELQSPWNLQPKPFLAWQEHTPLMQSMR